MGTHCSSRNTHAAPVSNPAAGTAGRWDVDESVPDFAARVLEKGRGEREEMSSHLLSDAQGPSQMSSFNRDNSTAIYLLLPLFYMEETGSQSGRVASPGSRGQSE